MEPENPGLEIMKAAAEGAGRQGIDKIANALGAPFPFWGMKKKAVDVYVKSIENGNYTPDEKFLLIAGARKHCKELENQMAIAEIAQESAKPGTDFSETSGVSDEFVSRLMDAGKHVSDEETQLLWGNILAGEFETPGSTPWSVIRILSELTKKYAEIFSSLCSLQIDYFADTNGEILKLGEYPLIDINTTSPYLKELGITFLAMEELERLGLINLNASSGYIHQLSYKEYPLIHLVSGTCVITITKYKDRSLPLGHITLTDAGKCISRFIPKKYNPAHMQAAKNFIEKRGVTCSPIPGIIITKATEGEIGTEYSYIRLSITPQQTQESQ